MFETVSRSSHSLLSRADSIFLASDVDSGSSVLLVVIVIIIIMILIIKMGVTVMMVIML